MAFRLDQAPLVDFCNQTQPASTPTVPPDPRLLVETSVRSRTSPAGFAEAKPSTAPASSTRAFRPELRTTTTAATPEAGGTLALAPILRPLAEP